MSRNWTQLVSFSFAIMGVWLGSCSSATEVLVPSDDIPPECIDLNNELNGTWDESEGSSTYLFPSEISFTKTGAAWGVFVGLGSGALAYSISTECDAILITDAANNLIVTYSAETGRCGLRLENWGRVHYYCKGSATCDESCDGDDQCQVPSNANPPGPTFPNVALSFRSSGSMSPDNQPPNLNCGSNLLGNLEGTDPSTGSKVFIAQQETEGTISPSSLVGCSSYDFKREFTADAELLLNGMPAPNQPTAGAPDDGTDGDEDLVPSQNARIYSTDCPAMQPAAEWTKYSQGLGLPRQPTNGDTVVLRTKFREWVSCTVSGQGSQNCSQDLDWCFVISAKFQGGQWARDPGQTNVIQQGSSCY